MKNKKMLIPVLLAIVVFFSLIPPPSAAGNSTMARSMASLVGLGQAAPMVAAGFYHTVGLEADGTLVAVGYDQYGMWAIGRISSGGLQGHITR